MTPIPATVATSHKGILPGSDIVFFSVNIPTTTYCFAELSIMNYEGDRLFIGLKSIIA